MSILCILALTCYCIAATVLLMWPVGKGPMTLQQVLADIRRAFVNRWTAK